MTSTRKGSAPYRCLIVTASFALIRQSLLQFTQFVSYEQPEAKIIQRVWLTQFDCVARTFRITSEETRDVNDKVIEWAQKRYSAIPITRGTVLDYFLEAACYDRWSQRLRAMGKQSNLNLSKALFELP